MCRSTLLQFSTLHQLSRVSQGKHSLGCWKKKSAKLATGNNPHNPLVIKSWYSLSLLTGNPWKLHVLFLTARCHEKNKAHPKQGIVLLNSHFILNFLLMLSCRVCVCVPPWRGHKAKFLVKCANIIKPIAPPLHLAVIYLPLSHSFFFGWRLLWCSYRLYKVVIHEWQTHSAPCKWSTESSHSTETVFLQCE